MPRPALAVGRHACRASPRTSSGNASCSTRATRWCRGRRNSAAATRACGSGSSSKRSTTAPARRSASRRTASSCSRRRSSSSARPNSRRAILPADGRRASRRGARAGRNRTRAATSPASRARRCATTPRGGWRLSGQKTWTTRGAFCTHLFGLFRSDPDAERHHGPHLLPRRPRDARRHRARRRTPRRRRRLRRGVLRRRVRPRRRRARRAEPGLGRRDGDHRFGARPHAALPGPLPRHRATAHRPVPRSAATTRSCATALVAAYIDAEAYRWQTFWTVTRIVDGERAGRGVVDGEGVLVGARRRACTSSRWSCSGRTPSCSTATDAAWMKGYEFALAGPIYAGTNEIQRNVIAERVLGLPRR